MTSAGERPHVMQGPDQRNTIGSERVHIDESAGDPVQMNQIRREIVDAPGRTVRQPTGIERPAGPPRGISKHRRQVQRLAQPGGDPAYSASRSEDGRILSVPDLNQHRRIDTDRSEAGVQTVNSPRRAASGVLAVDKHRPHRGGRHANPFNTAIVSSPLDRMTAAVVDLLQQQRDVIFAKVFVHCPARAQPMAVVVQYQHATDRKPRKEMNHLVAG